MNKYDEALNDISKFIKSVREKYEGAEKYSWAWGVYEDEINKLQELVDKATPKKVIETKNVYYYKPIITDVSIGNNYHKKITYMLGCPYCHHTFGSYEHITNMKYCNQCGQALDWSTND